MRNYLGERGALAAGMTVEAMTAEAVAAEGMAMVEKAGSMVAVAAGTREKISDHSANQMECRLHAPRALAAVEELKESAEICHWKCPS